MEHQLCKFDINGLYKSRDYSIVLQDNKLLIVGENGAGKTTIFKIMYYTLICDWDSLRKISFDSIVLYFENMEPITISSELLHNIYAAKDIDRVDYYVDDYHHKYRRRNNLLNSVIKIKASIVNPNSDYDRRDLRGLLPYQYIEALMENSDVEELFLITEKIDNMFKGTTILYLPTYRRIEEELYNIFPELNKEDFYRAKNRRPERKRSIELIEFGMSDVDTAVKEYQERLNQFSRDHQNKLTLGYLSEIISERYEKTDVAEIVNLTDQQISDILNRIDSSILPDDQKSEIFRILFDVKNSQKAPNNVKEKIVCHYFLKLIVFDKDLTEEEAGMLEFINRCNKYLVGNVFEYDNKTFSCEICNRDIMNEKDGEYREDKKNIKFQELSSGEKQIVSLFSHLDLKRENNWFVFIDEPELSLSVDWQRMFLVDIVDSSNCVGLIAATHSPFVFDNDLEKYVHGINEFCTRG